MKGNLHAAGLLRLQVYIAAAQTLAESHVPVASAQDARRLPIQPNTNRLQLNLQQRPLLSPLRRIQNHKNQITRLRRTNNLSPAPLALGSTLNNTRQIKNLDLGAAILEHARDRCEGRKAVRSDFGAGLGDLGQEGRLTDRGEADEGDARVAGFADVEAGAAGAAGGGGLEELGTEAGEFSGGCEINEISLV